MKATLFTFLFACVMAVTVSAQPFEVGINMANLGLAIGGDLDVGSEG